MKRSLVTVLAGEEIELAATFNASVEIMEKVADPLAIARDAAAEQALAQMGMVFDGKFKWTVKNLPIVLHIGMKAAGDKRDLQTVQEMVFQHGFIEALTIGVQYVTLTVTPQTDEAGDEKGESGAGE